MNNSGRAVIKAIVLGVALLLTSGLRGAPSTQTIADYIASIESEWPGAGVDRLCSSIDADALCRRAFVGSGVSPESIPSLSDTFRKMRLTKLRSVLARCPYLKALPSQAFNGSPVLVFRIPSVAGGLDYVQLQIDSRSPPDQVRIVDYFLGSEGEWQSASFRKEALIGLSRLNRLAGASNQAVDNYIRSSANELYLAARLMDANQWGKALAIFDKLPPDLRRDGWVQVLRAGCAKNLDEAASYKVIREWEAVSPRNTALNLLAMEAHARNKNYTSAHAALTRLGAVFPGDPYLQAQKGLINSYEEKYADAEKCIELAIEQEPTLEPAWFLLMDVYRKQKNWTGLKNILVRFDQQIPENTAAEFIGITLYQEFRDSAEYRQWLATRPRVPVKPTPQTPVIKRKDARQDNGFSNHKFYEGPAVAPEKQEEK